MHFHLIDPNMCDWRLHLLSGPLKESELPADQSHYVPVNGRVETCVCATGPYAVPPEHTARCELDLSKEVDRIVRHVASTSAYPASMSDGARDAIRSEFVEFTKLVEKERGTARSD